MEHLESPRARASSGPAACVLALAGFACITPKDKIEGDDRAPILPGARVSVDLLPSKHEAVAAAPANEFHLLLDLQADYGEGDFTQVVTPPSQISLGGTGFSGNVDVDFALLTAAVDVRASGRFANGLGVDGFVGVGVADLDIELSQGAVSDQEDVTTFGPLVGAGVSYAPIERVRVYGEGRLSYGFGSSTEGVDVRTWEAGLEFELAPHAALAGGWRQVLYEAEFDDLLFSDIELDLSGPFVALRVTL